MTATPYRLDGKGLGTHYKSVVDVAQIDELIAQGYLVKPRYFGAQITPNLRRIKKVAHDYNQGELSTECRKREIISGVIDSAKKYADRHVIIYAVDCAHAQDIAAQLPGAAYLDGKTDEEERYSIIQRFQSGELRCIVNVQCLTEGLDAPICDCIIMARPTCSMALYRQSAGRSLRPFTDKREALIIDHGENVIRHGFLEQRVDYTLDDGLVLRKKKAVESLHTCRYCLATFAGMQCALCG